MQVSYKIAMIDDAPYFEHVEAGLFDHPIKPDLLREFLTDPRHHIAIALVENCMVGFVSAIDYLHPDKPRELWINEVGVFDSWRKRGIAKALLLEMIDHARNLNCAEAWVLTEAENGPANALYSSLGKLRKVEKSMSIMYILDCR